MTDQPLPPPPGDSAGQPPDKRRYPHVYYRRERRAVAAPPILYDDDGMPYADAYAGFNPRDLPDPRDLDRGDEPPDDPAAGGQNPVWKWLIVGIMVLVVIAMIAADLQGIVVPPDVLPTPTRPLMPL